jgi:hypothetical protein
MNADAAIKLLRTELEQDLKCLEYERARMQERGWPHRYIDTRISLIEDALAATKGNVQ